MGRPYDPPVLLGIPELDQRRGPVEKGTRRQVKAMLAAGSVDARLQAGTIAQALACARAVDVASGWPNRRQHSGMQLAALHTQLDALMVRLESAVDVTDPFDAFLTSLDPSAHDDAAAPHAPQP